MLIGFKRVQIFADTSATDTRKLIAGGGHVNIVQLVGYACRFGIYPTTDNLNGATYTPGGTLQATVTIANASAAPDDAKIFVARYNLAGQLAQLVPATVTVQPGTHGFPITYQLPPDLSNSVVKIFVWHADTYAPLAQTTIADGTAPGAAKDVDGVTGHGIFVPVTVYGESSFAGKIFKIAYSSDKAELVDFAAQTEGDHVSVGAIDGTDLAILSAASGEITFSTSRSIPDGTIWSGVLTVMKFYPLESSVFTVTLQQI